MYLPVVRTVCMYVRCVEFSPLIAINQSLQHETSIIYFNVSLSQEVAFLIMKIIKSILSEGEAKSIRNGCVCEKSR